MILETLRCSEPPKSPRSLRQASHERRIERRSATARTAGPPGEIPARGHPRTSPLRLALDDVVALAVHGDDQPLRYQGAQCMNHGVAGDSVLLGQAVNGRDPPAK